VIRSSVLTPFRYSTFDYSPFSSTIQAMKWGKKRKKGKSEKEKGRKMN
jgi:hypothetical protein